MTHIILFRDNPSADPGLRQKHMPAHLAFLNAHKGEITAAGPLFDTDGLGAGGMWLLDQPDPARIEQLVQDDPFWPTGLRHSHQILRWKRVFSTL